MSGDRIRYSLAHELGHIVMHRIPHDKIEDEANYFAGEFLLPENEIRAYLSNISIESLANLKRYWKVSMQAILVHAYRLNKITYNQYSYMWRRMSQLGYKLKEPIEIPREKPMLLQELVNVYIQEYGYSKGELKFLLHLNDEDYEKFNPPHISTLRVVPNLHNIPINKN